MNLSPTQRAALARLAVGPFVRTVAGWHHAGDSLGAYSTMTMTALSDRGLVRIALDNNRIGHWTARLTAAGRQLAAEAHAAGDAA